MGDELSLLYRIRGDAAGAKQATAETRAAVAQLRQTLGPELNQGLSVANKAFSEIGDNLNAFVGQRLPLVGGAFLRVTANLKGLNEEMKKGGPQTAALAKQIDSIATSSGKTSTEVARFLTTFVRLEGQTARNDAAFKFFGGSVDLVGNKTAKFVPELEQAGASMGALATETETTGASMAALAGPIGIAIAALAAEIVVVVSLTKEIFNLAKASADYQGKLFDLSQQTGVSVETLSALESAARKTGGSIEGLVQSLGIFQKHLEDANDPTTKSAQAFRELGVDASNTEDALVQTIAALARMPEGFEQTAKALELFGRGGKAFLAIAKETNGDLGELRRRLKDMGGVTTEQAKLADDFNDTLVDLEFQLRGLGTRAIPVITEALKDLSKFVKQNHIVFSALQGIIEAVALTITIPFRAAIGFIKTELDKIQFVLSATAAMFERIKQSIEFIIGHPVSFPGLSQQPTTEPGVPTPKATDSGDKAFREGLFQEIQDRKKLQAELNFQLADRQRQAEAAIALAQREFEAGKRTRQQLLEATIDGTRRQIKAQLDALQEERDIKLREAALETKDVEKRTKISNDILAIDTQMAAKRDELRQKELDLKAKSQLDEQKADLAHQQAQLDTLTRLGQERIAFIEDQIKREQVDRQVGVDQIEKIENASLQARGQLLKRELQIAGIGPDRQVVLDKIKALETDRTALERQQSERRKQISREEAESKRQILLSSLDTLLQIEQIRGNAQIATIQALANLRVTTEEQAARKILAVRLRLLDDEIEATKAKQAAAAGITDADERKRVQADLTNQIKILNAEREALQEEGNRDIDEGRQKDLENARRYAHDLEEIQERITDIQRDTAEEVIRLMRLHFSRRKDIIRAQLELDLADEEARHKRVTDSIKAQQSEVDEQIRILEQHLKSLKIGTTEEIEQYERLIEELEKLRLKRDELKRQQDAEDEKSKTRKRRVTKEADKDTEDVDPLDKLKIGSEDIKKFAQELEDSVVPLGEILSGTFNQVAQAIGSVVEQWVLLGTTGPAVMRKILAQALASIAAEAAVNAIKELAVGFALLAVGDFGGAGNAFLSAAIWGSIGGVAAIAGRKVAGDLFKPKQEGANKTNSPGALNTTITSGRNPPPQVNVTVKLQGDDSKLANFITAHVVSNIGNAGEIREAISNDGRAA